MNKDFLSLLIHPVNKTDLHFDENANLLRDGKDSFEIVQSVPILLAPKSETEANSFDYQAHYETDAEAFDYFADWHPVHQEENRRLHQQILGKVPEHAKLILDVGCGGAWLSESLLPKGKQVISMDISTRNPITAICKNKSEHHFGLVADVYHLPLKANSIDCIVAAEIIEHVENPALFVAKLWEVLKPGGTLIITTPYNETIPKSLCIHCNQLTPHNAHLHSFTQEKIASLLPKGAAQKSTKIFNSKILVNLQIHLLLRFLPFSLWSLIDGFLNNLFGKRALRLMLVAKK